MAYAQTRPARTGASVANGKGAAFDAASLGGSGKNADGGADNGKANDASTYVANDRPAQGQTFATGNNADGYLLTGITVQMAGYADNVAQGDNEVRWNLNPSNGPILVSIGQIQGTEAVLVSRQAFMAGGPGNPGAGGSRNGPGTTITFTLPFPVHLGPNSVYGFDLAVGNGSSNFFEWLGTGDETAFPQGTAYTRQDTTITPLKGDRVFMAHLTACTEPPAPFVHPGTLHTRADLERMKAKVEAGTEPWTGSYKMLAASPYAQPGRQPRPQETIVRGGRGGNNYTPSQMDSNAIYELALRWHVAGDRACADRAVAIANAWAGKLKGISGDSNLSLASGLCGYEFAIGGELLCSYPGWKEEDKQAYKAMMMRVFYPANFDFLWRHHGTPVAKGGNTHYRLNWDTCNMASMAAIGILCDNRAVYQQAVDYFKEGAGNGRVERAVWYLHPNGLGQTEEIGRDQGHNLGGWYSMALLCQMAWNQGDDLFGYDNNRVLRAFEANAKYNLGQEVPWVFHRNSDLAYTETVSDKGRGLGTPTYELVYNHYANVKGIDAPYNRLAVEKVRPEPGPNTRIHPAQLDWFGFGSLTFAREAGPVIPPSGLTANWSQGRITLAWWGSAGAAKYTVSRAIAEAGPFTAIGTVEGPGLSFADPDAKEGTTYYYTVSTVSPEGKPLSSPPLRVAQELMVHYRFDGNAADAVAGRNARGGGGSSGLPAFVPGKIGQAVSLDGNGQYVQLPKGIANSQDLTVAAWVYWKGGKPWQRIFDFGSEIEKCLFLTPSTGGKMQFQITTSRGTDGTGTLEGPVLPTNRWVHVAVTLGGDTGTLFVDGQPVDSKPINQVDPLFSQVFCYLGRSQYNNDPYFNGMIDDFRIYNYALPAEAVRALGQPKLP